MNNLFISLIILLVTVLLSPLIVRIADDIVDWILKRK